MTGNHKTLADVVNSAASTGIISDEDVLVLRSAVYGDHVISPDEAHSLFALAHKRLENRSWKVFFVEAMSDYLVKQVAPRGYVDEANSKWLMEQISSRDVPTALELEVVVNIINKAKSSPPAFSAFGLELVKKGVLEGEGTLRNGSALQPGVIGAAEVDFLKMVLYGMGGQGNVGISREEAEVLFDINDMVGDADNHPSWPDLFVKAVANYLMAHSGYKAPARQEALASEQWRDDDRISIGGFFSKVFAGSLRDITKSYSLEEAAAEKSARDALAISASEVVDSTEANWLVERVNRDGKVHENERALLRFIRDTSPDIHPKLVAMLKDVA